MVMRHHDPLDISSHAFWAKPPAQRDSVFAELRRERPISWHPPAETVMLPDEDDPGFWAVVKHADIVSASRNPETFSSDREVGGVMLENFPPDMYEATLSIIAMDAPAHTQQRNLIRSVFTPRRVSRIEGQIRAQAKAIVDGVAEKGECDFAVDVAARLPMWTFSEMVGVPEPDREPVAAAAHGLVAWHDPEFVTGDDPMMLSLNSMTTMHRVAFEMIEERRSRPVDDIMTALVQAEIDGEQLTENEIAAFFVLLAVAGNDTTRQSTSHALLALQEFPDQRALLLSDFDEYIDTAVEEFIRWASPVLTFRRTVMQDTVLGGQEMAAGEKIIMFYQSGNRDADVFPDPYRLDLTRKPNLHVGFGGGGPHFCLGAHVARMQMRAILDEVLHRLPEIEVCGEPEFLQGNFINGIKRLPASWKVEA